MEIVLLALGAVRQARNVLNSQKNVMENVTAMGRSVVTCAYSKITREPMTCMNVMASA